MTTNAITIRYKLATGLKGFSKDTLRVKIIQEFATDSNIVTADLADAGTILRVSNAQLVDIGEEQTVTARELFAANQECLGGAELRYERAASPVVFR